MTLTPLDRPAPRFGIVSFLAMLLYGLAALWLGGFLHYVAGVRDLGRQASERRTDAIVVLTGGSERIDAGLRLLQAERARKLFITGVNKGTNAEMLQQLRGQYPPQLFACCVELGTAAEDTVGNAAETAIWVRKEGYRSLRLVTAAYHLHRAMIEFRRFMPATELLPHPVFTEAVRLESWWQHPGTARLLAGEFNKYIVSLLRARLLDRRR